MIRRLDVSRKRNSIDFAGDAKVDLGVLIWRDSPKWQSTRRRTGMGKTMTTTTATMTK